MGETAVQYQPAQQTAGWAPPPAQPAPPRVIRDRPSIFTGRPRRPATAPAPAPPPVSAVEPSAPLQQTAASASDSLASPAQPPANYAPSSAALAQSAAAAAQPVAETAPSAAPPVKTGLSPRVDADPSHAPENVLYLDLSNGGRVAIRLMPQWAPNHVERIKTLVEQGFYNGIVFHRVIDGFMAQTGDPTGTGAGGSKLPDLRAEFNAMPHLRGTVSMARTEQPDSANSQFFIVFYPRFALDRKYTVFGRVIGGMDVVDRIERGEPPANPTKIVQASLAIDNRAPPVIAAPAPVAAISLDQLNNSKPN